MPRVRKAVSASASTTSGVTTSAPKPARRVISNKKPAKQAGKKPSGKKSKNTTKKNTKPKTSKSTPASKSTQKSTQKSIEKPEKPETQTEKPETTSPTETSEPQVEAKPTATDEFKSVEETLRDFAKLAKALEKKVRNGRKLMDQELKEFRKLQKKLKEKEANKKKRKPAGIAKPGPISKELSAFLGVEPGTELARIEVTKQITAYIKKHNLQNPEDRRKIICDDRLMALLNVSPTDDVNFFNLQTLMKPHYIKKPTTTTTTT